MASIDLAETLAHVTPVLEQAIRDDRDCFNSRIDADLMLRMPHCGIASRAIQIFLSEKHGLATTTLLNQVVPEDFEHAVLAHEDTIIDATYGQFMCLAGLTHKTAVDHDLKRLYPTPAIAIYKTADYRQFADTFTDHLVAAAAEMPASVLPRSFRPETVSNTRSLFRALWNIDNYTPYEFHAPHFQHITRRVADQLLDA
jgi:hypothetical protein